MAVVTFESLKLKDATGYINHLLIGPSISQQQGYYVIDGLLDKGLIKKDKMQTIIDRTLKWMLLHAILLELIS